MKEKILTALKTEYKNLGFGEKTFNAAADSLVAMGLVTDENLDAVVKGQKALLTSIQSEIDTRITSVQTKSSAELESLAKSLGYADWSEMKDARKIVTPQEAELKPNTTADIAKIVAETLKPLTEKLSLFEQQAAQKNRNEEVMTKAKEYGIPETFVTKFNIAPDANLDDYFGGVKQEFANIGYAGARAPEVGAGTVDNSNSIASLINQGTKEIVELKK